MQFVEDASSETAVCEHMKPNIIDIRCAFEGFMLTCLQHAVFLDPDVTICVRGATGFQNFEDVPSETATTNPDGTLIIASELYSLGEVRMRICVCVCVYVCVCVCVLYVGARFWEDVSSETALF